MKICDYLRPIIKFLFFLGRSLLYGEGAMKTGLGVRFGVWVGLGLAYFTGLAQAATTYKVCQEGWCDRHENKDWKIDGALMASA